MTMLIRVGVVGANARRGWARDAHIPALASLSGRVRLESVSARSRAIADEAQQAFGAARSFDDSLQMVVDPAIDLVAVTVKVPEHRAVVLAALAAGKHVYCEWPLGQTAEEAAEMAAAVPPGSHVMIGLQALSSPAVRRATALVASGAMGALETLRVVSPTSGWGAEAPATYAYLQDRASGASFEAIAGGHTLALVEAVVGRYNAVDARCTTLRPQVGIIGTNEMVARTCFDHMAVLGAHESGCVSTVEIVSGTSTTPFVFELAGSEGWLRLTGGGPGGYQTGRLALETSATEHQTREDEVDSCDGAPVGLAASYARLLDDIAYGTHTVPNFEDAVRLMNLLDVAAHASRTGQRQSIVR